MAAETLLRRQREAVTEKLLVDRAEAARLMSLCVRSVDALLERGELACIRMNPTAITEKSGRTYSRAGKVLVDVADIRRWIDAKKSGQVAQGVA